ncbi:CDGSH iron-sulfur domain-containing protein [Thiosocius teredinicola]|uniref:CDGSH iron-sulfur domain-containing protein n=1 Tax=Thiosocius teredinicola TaxID=1973002 RepID=UPI000990CA39
MSSDEITKYEGKEVTVSWDERLCIGIAECGKSEGELFVGGRDPWCIPDKSQPDEVVDICTRCPSGALSVHDASGGLVEQLPTENSVFVVYNGPLYVSGDLAIDGAPDDMPGIRYRAALCRCGKSTNKPFCDNSHQKAGFEDTAAVGEKGPGTHEPNGELHIEPLKDGPLMLKGGVVIFAGSGRAAWRGEKVALCRCGHSSNKPFCDGSHAKEGFKSEE